MVRVTRKRGRWCCAAQPFLTCFMMTAATASISVIELVPSIREAINTRHFWDASTSFGSDFSRRSEAGESHAMLDQRVVEGQRRPVITAKACLRPTCCANMVSFSSLLARVHKHIKRCLAPASRLLTRSFD